MYKIIIYLFMGFTLILCFYIRLQVDERNQNAIKVENIRTQDPHIFEVRDDPEYKYFTTSAVGIDRTINKHVIITGDKNISAKLAAFDVGDKFLATGSYLPLNEYEQYLKQQHIIGKFSIEKFIGAEQGENIIEKTSNYVRRQISRGCSRLGDDTHGICEGILIGEKSHISKATYDKYKQAQLTHLLVASGANIVFIISFLKPILTRLKLRMKYSIMCFVAIFFCIITRFEPSILRATVMICIPSIARIRGYKLNEIKIFMSSIIVCLFIDPFLIYRVGFWLSASATGGLYFLTPIIYKYIRSELIASTLGATLAVQPVLFIAFGFNLPFKWPISVVAIAIGEPLSTIGFVFTYISSYLDPANIISNLFSNLMHGGCSLLNLTAAFGQSSFATYSGLLLSVLISIVYNRKRAKQRYKDFQNY